MAHSYRRLAYEDTITRGPNRRAFDSVLRKVFEAVESSLRVWRLRDNLSSYDASYVALAEALDALLITADRRLAKAVGVLCEVDVLR